MSVSDLRAKMKAMMLVDDSQSSTSERYWKLTPDSNGNSTAVIRFLPQSDLSKLPYVTVYNHYFTHPVTGKTYDALSGSTWKEADPMSEFNSWLWKRGEESKVRSQKRQTRIYSNIMVIRDPAKPENEGKVFIFRFGVKILDKIKGQLTPDFEDDVPVNVFDMFSGKNFRIKSKMVDKYPNYDDSSFESNVTAVSPSDEEIERIFGQVHDLESMFLDKSKDKSYDDKLKLMIQVFGRDPLFLEWMEAMGDSSMLGSSKSAPKAREQVAAVEEDDDLPPWDEPAPKAAKPASKEAPEPRKASSASADVDDILSELGL